MRTTIAAIGTALALILAAGTAAAEDKLKVCFVYVGPHNDGGWSEGHEHGREMLQEALEDQVESSYVENVAEGPDAERAIEPVYRALPRAELEAALHPGAERVDPAERERRLARRREAFLRRYRR